MCGKSEKSMAEEGKKAGREMQGLVDVGMNNDSI